jgi:hypothetical protein
VPPLYDDIVDALALTQDGAEHVVNLDCQDATFETNEETDGEGWEGVWLKIDLSAAPDMPVEVMLDAVKTGGDAGFHPYIDVYKVIDASFDPASPDFTKIDWISGAFTGDGTDDPPPDTFDLNGGTGSSSGSRSESGIFYLIFTDWDFAGYGTADLTYSIANAPLCFDAVDIINGDCATASVVSGRVRTEWDEVNSPHIQPEPPLKMTWAGPSGLYMVTASGRFSNPGAGTFSVGQVQMTISVNGKAIYPTRSARNLWEAFDTSSSG